MSRYLIDVVLTVEVECPSPADIEASVRADLDVLPPLFVQLVEMGDFTVIEP